MSRVKIAVAFLVTVGAMTFAAAPAHAENHFLNESVPVLGTPELDQNAGDFALAQTDSGEAIAFWGQGDGMFVSVRPADGDFGAPVLVSTNGSGTGLPQVAMSPNGHAVVVWRGTVLGKSQVLSATRPAGASSFNEPVQVSFEPFSVPAVKPEVDVADDGSAVVVWRGYDVDGDDNSSRIRWRSIDTAGELDGPITNASPASATGVDFPHVAVGPNGHSLISWVVGDQFTGDPATLWMGPGGATPDVQTFDTNTGGIPRAAVDGTGLSIIVYKDNTTVLGDRRPAGAGQNFLFDQNLTLPATQGFTPLVEMDENGKATVAFPGFGGGDWGVQTADRTAGPDAFFGATSESVSDREDLEKLSLAVGADGTVMQAWQDDDGRVYGTVRNAGAVGFSPISGPISPPIETGAVRAETDGNGKGILAYSTSTAPAEDFSISALPYDDVPTAETLSIPATATVGQAVNFSVAAVDAWADVTGFEWTLDTGVVKNGQQVSHTYTTPGERTVKIKLTDAAGNTNTVEGTILVNAVPPDKVKPKVTGFKVKFKRAKAKKKNAFIFKLSERARVVIKAKKISKGKGRGKVGKIVKKSKGKGRHKLNFRKKIGKRKLRPGVYRATIVATDKAGNRSKPRKLKFRIIG